MDNNGIFHFQVPNDIISFLSFSDVPKDLIPQHFKEHMTCQKDRQPEVDGKSTWWKENHLKSEMLKNHSRLL